VESIIQQLDKRTVQVFIEVAIVDVTLDDTTKFGVEWKWNDGQSSADTGFGLADAIPTGLRYSVISNNLQAVLRALTTKSNVKVYSTPTITTADNVRALISIGRQEPFVSSVEDTAQGGAFRRTVDFKDVSISLDVTPHVSEAANLITLEVIQTINELLGREEELNAPIIASRQAQTTVMVNDGQTIVIGGIIKDNKQRVVNGVPILEDIPILGELFKSRRWQTEHSELMVFMTPHILRDEQSVTERTAVEKAKLSPPGNQ
jgi:general secretion pathway protein D